MRPIQSVINRLKRLRYKKTKKQKTQIAPFRYWIWLRRVAAIVLVLWLVNQLLFPFATAFYKFKLQTEPSAGVYNEYEWKADDRVMILVAGLDQTDATHVFVDSLSLIQLSDDQQSKVGIIGVNPDLRVYFGRDSATLRTIYNSDFAAGSEVVYLLKGVESIIGARVDKYVLLNEQGFNEIFANMPNVPIDLANDMFENDKVNDAPAGITLYEGEQVLEPAQFLPYLAADVDGKDNQIYRSGLFIKESLRNVDSLETMFALPRILSKVSAAMRTNISAQEAIRMLLLVRGVRSDQIKVAYTKSNSTVLVGTNGIYEVRSGVPERIDNDLEAILLDPDNVAEQATVEVLNGSGVFGIASSRARRINNTGVRVINVGNSFDQYERTTIFVTNKEEFPDSLRTIEHIFSHNVVYSEDPYKYKHIGDIIVIIGENYE